MFHELRTKMNTLPVWLHRGRRPLVSIFALLAVGWTSFVAGAERGKKDTPEPTSNLPKFELVEETTEAYFSGLKDYQTGDILSQGDVKPLFAKLEKLGWKVDGQDEFLDRLLPETDYVVKQLRTRNGKKFMRHLSGFPGGYDRFDRMRRLPDGKRMLRQLMRSRDGYKLFEYMTTTKGGKNLGRSLSRSRKGKGFNQPTGKMYTADDVTKELKQLYDAAAEPPGGKRKRGRRGRTRSHKNGSSPGSKSTKPTEPRA